jgi:1,4-dihydroxy-2-naphthoyl-CoA hydrolase
VLTSTAGHEPHDCGSVPIPADLDGWNRLGQDWFPGLLGVRALEVREGYCRAGFRAARGQAPHGYLHGGAVVTLADTACGFGCLASLPAGAAGFTTIDLTASFLATVNDGPVLAEARLAHAGRRTQVWDAVVTGEQAGRAIALFRCTQMIRYPRARRA